ncbi:MAG: thioester dehydrase [Neisseriaceae bacterium]|nr:thioester dehydrase [Neisseriaceae bacterium]
MIECPFRQPAKLLPHTGKIVLLDSVLKCIDNRVVALATIQKDCILLPTDTATHLPTYLAIEIMAQTVGAWAGAVALSHGEKVRIGFLLGTRRFEMPVAEIQVGTELRCEATLSWQDDTGMGVFDCVLLNHQNEEKIATASLNLYRPNEQDLQQILDNEQ